MMRLAARLLQRQSRSAASGWGSGAAATTAAGAGFAWAAGTPAASTTDAAAWNGGGPEQWHGQDPQKSFVVRAAHLKKRLKGQSQYAYAREQGQRFVDAEVPKAGLAAWLEEDGNAVALAQILNFFEIQPEASVAATLRGALLQRTDDTTLAPSRRAYAALCLVQYCTDEHYFERALRCVEQVLAQMAATPAVSTDLSALHTMGYAEAREATYAFSQYGDTLGVVAKVLQRCGRRVPRALNDELARLVLQHVSTAPPAYYPYMKKSLLRFYAWMVRAEHPASNQILFLLVEHAGAMSFHEFSNLVLATLRHHQRTPLPVELIQRLTQHALTYTGRFSCLDTANILGSLAKVLVSLAPGVNGVSPAALDTARDTFAALLTELQGRVRRFLDPADRLHTRDAVLNSTIVFAYEWGGHVRYRSVFQAYGAFFERYVDSFEPPQLALATGILRRAQLLTPQLAAQLSARLEVVLGELRLPELSHICATFAVLPPGPQQLTWWSEAKAVAARLKADDATGVVRLNLALAFPEETSWVEGVNYDDISTKQLVDLLPLVMGFAQFRDAMVSALVARLTIAEARLSSDDVRVVLSCGDPVLVQAGQAYLRRAFAEPVWHSDTLLALPLVCDPTNPEANQQHLGTAKAVAAARVAAVAPRQFVDFADLLLTTFGDSDAAVRQYVVDGGTDLVQNGCDAVLPGVQYLALVRRYPSLTMNMEWLRSYTVHVEGAAPLERDDLEDLLLSLRSLFEDVAKAPALQTLLSHLLDRSYGYSTEVDEQTARITVLFVYLQCGMTLPLVTAQHPIVTRVLQSEAAFSPEVRKALAMMPLPRQAPAEERRGRFVLKRLEPPHKRGARAVGSEDDGHALSLDLNAGDPFDEPYATQGEAAAAAEVEEERRKGLEGADQRELSPPPSSASAPHREAGATTAANAATATPSSHADGSSAAHSDVLATAAGKTQAVAAVVDGSASPATSADEPPTTAANTNTAAASTDAAAAPAPEPEEKPMSYYAKFFSSSVGQIFTGRGNHDATKQQQQQQQPQQRQSTASASPTSAAVETAGKTEQVVPRRTRLQPSHHVAAASTSTPTSTAAAAGAGSAPAALQPEVSPAATATAAATPPQPPAQSSTPAAVPVTTFTTAWGTPQPALATAAGGALPVMPSWAFAPLANTAASGAATHKPTSAAAAALERHHNTAFSSLFGSPPPPVAAASPTAAAPVSAVPRPSGVGGNNIFVDPSNPHTQRSRPVMSRKVVITRPGSAFANHATSNATAAAAAAAEQEEWKGVSSGVVSSSGAAPAVVLNAPPPLPQQQQQQQQPAAAAAPFPNGGDGVQGMTQFMQQTGVTKITGYSVDEESNGGAAAGAEEAGGATATQTIAATPTGGADGRPALDWMDAARRVARVTRHPRSKVKSRTHTSLSAWLSTPSARLDAAAPATSASTTAGAAAAAGGVSSGAAANSNAPTTTAAAAPPTRQTTVAATVHRRRTKQEKKEAAANAAAARAAAKADKAATKAAAKAEAKAAAAEAAAAAAAGQSGKRGGRGKAGKVAAGKNAGKTSARASTRGGRASAAPSTAASTAAAKKRTPARKAATTKAAAAAAGGSGGASGKKGGGAAAAAARAKPAAKASVKAAKKTVKAAVKKATAKKAPKAAKNKKK